MLRVYELLHLLGKVELTSGRACRVRRSPPDPRHSEPHRKAHPRTSLVAPRPQHELAALRSTMVIATTATSTRTVSNKRYGRRLIIDPFSSGPRDWIVTSFVQWRATSGTFTRLLAADQVQDPFDEIVLRELACRFYTFSLVPAQHVLPTPSFESFFHCQHEQDGWIHC